MGKVVLSTSVSLDGFAAGINVGVKLPMGEGGLRLHDWLLRRPMGEANAQVVQELYATTGAVVLGRRTFDVGVGLWGDTPFPVPCFVLTHEVREKRVEKSGVFTFATEGLECAVKQAKAAAGGKNVGIMGVDTARQCLKAGLVDELQLQLVPIVLGQGARLFDRLGSTLINLECTRVVEGVDVTHLHYRVVKSHQSVSRLV